MTTEQQIKSAIDSLNEAMQALRELGLLTEEEEDTSVGNCDKCNSWDDCLESGVCQTCIKEEEE